MIKKIVAFVKREFLDVLPPTLFFFFIFQLLTFTRLLLSKQYEAPVISPLTATINALILGKCVLITEHLPFFNWFTNIRLIYNILWRTFLYVTVVLLFEFLEDLVPSVLNGNKILTAIGNVIHEMTWIEFYYVHTFVITLLLVYGLIKALVKAIGRDRVLQLLLSSENSEIAEVKDR